MVARALTISSTSNWCTGRKGNKRAWNASTAEPEHGHEKNHARSTRAAAAVGLRNSAGKQSGKQALSPAELGILREVASLLLVVTSLEMIKILAAARSAPQVGGNSTHRAATIWIVLVVTTTAVWSALNCRSEQGAEGLILR